MNCPDCQDWLQEYLDGLAPGPKEDLPGACDEHLRACAECRELYGAARRLDDGLHLLPPPEPPAELADRVVAEALRERRARRALRRVVSGCLAVAASLLLALGTYRVSHTPQTTAYAPPPPPDPPPVGAGLKPAPTETPPEEVPGPLPAPMNEVRSLVQDLANETMNETRQMLPGVKAPSLDELDLGPPLEPPARSLREATESVSTGLEPVTDSARRAVGLFLRDLPPMDPSGKPGL
jgi:hypothetical protein